TFGTFLPTPPVVGDVDGDGKEEIIIGTYDPAATPSSGSLYIYALDGTLKQSLPVPGGLKHIPFLADANGDGSLDVIYRSLAGMVYVQNFGATSATNVSWATHRGNAERDANRGKALFPLNTPLVTKHEGGFRKAMFQWSAVPNASGFRIYRSENSTGPFAAIANLPSTALSFSDSELRVGWQYFYEVAAVVGTGEVHSSPFAILSLCNSNLVSNGAFEENDNSHWDKWDTGNIPWTNMIGSTSTVYQGKQSMEITLQNQTTTDSINQYAHYGTPRSYIPVVPGTMYSFGGFLKGAGLNQTTKHWFEWTSSLTGESTNARPLFPYPNYFTPQFSIGSAVTPWTYLNRVFTLPAGFPNVEIRHRMSSPLAVSGKVYIDNVFFRALPAPTDSRWTNILSFGSTWKYLSATPPSNWYATNFNDSGWVSGNAKFGRGGTPTNVVTQLPANQPSYYFRKNFVVTQTNLDEFLLAATCTDDYGGVIYPLKIYLNGTELITSGIEAVNTGNTLKYFDLFPFVNLLKPGTNTIAVILNNVWQSTWDDVAFDIALKTIPAPESGTARINTVRYTPTGVNLEIIASLGMAVRVESSSGISGPWQLVQLLPSISVSPLWITDLTQVGAVFRYYRLTAP
ncbi:MAG: FG-GAP-like repeat-containing protein, partial [Verrucomicrobiota bacterium]